MSSVSIVWGFLRSLGSLLNLDLLSLQEESISPILDFKFDVAEDLDMQRPSQRHQLFAAAAAGNLSPIPSDNENGELAATSSMSEPYDHDDLPEDTDITAERPPHWDYELDGDEDQYKEDDDLLLSSRHRSYTDSNDSLESFERMTAKFSEDTNGLSSELKMQQEIYEDSISRSTPALPTTTTTPATPTSPNAPSSPMKLLEKSSQKAPDKPRGGARIIVPKVKAPKPATNGSSTKSSPTYRTKPAKSKLPKMEHIQSTIPKPRPKQNPATKQTEADKKAALAKAINRENKSSINRKKNLVIQQSRDLEEEAKETDYLTPLQKKNNYIKDLEHKLKETKAKLEIAERDVAKVDIIIKDKTSDIVAQKEDEVRLLKEQIAEMEIVSENLQKSYKDALSTIRAYEDTVEEMKVRLRFQCSRV